MPNLKVTSHRSNDLLAFTAVSLFVARHFLAIMKDNKLEGNLLPNANATQQNLLDEYLLLLSSVKPVPLLRAL